LGQKRGREAPLGLITAEGKVFSEEKETFSNIQKSLIVGREEYLQRGEERLQCCKSIFGRGESWEGGRHLSNRKNGKKSRGGGKGGEGVEKKEVNARAENVLY